MEIEHISREAAWNGIYNCPTKTDADGYIWVRTKDVAHMIDDIPAADVWPVVRATWENEMRFKNEDGSLEWHGLCSHCLMTFSTSDVYAERMNFCPNCGADMRGKCND